MEQFIQKENNINNSNKQSTLDTNKNSILFYNNGNYFSFGKDNSFINKSAPNTSSFNIKENIKQSENVSSFNIANNNTFLNKKRKLMTSEELELEQIERERKEVKKMIQKNMALYYRTKSGTTTIVSKIKDNIYNTNSTNTNKNTILNNYINNNNNNNNKINCLLNTNTNINKNNSYLMNFMKEKGINNNNNINKSVNCDNNINKTEIINNNPKDKIIEIINTDINNNDKISVKEEIDNKNENIISLREEKEDKEEINKVDECNTKNIEEKPESEKKDVENENLDEILAIKTPNKESSYLTKMKQLGSMSKLPLCNKIQKYTEICKEVLKEQEGGEENKAEKRKEKKVKKGKKKNKNSKK